ncbi:hypothetical protein [Streptomyces cinereoruber]
MHLVKRSAPPAQTTEEDLRGEAAVIIAHADGGEVDARFSLGLEPHPAYASEAVGAAVVAVRAALKALDSPWAVYEARDGRATLAAVTELLRDAHKTAESVLVAICAARSRGDIADAVPLQDALHAANEMARALPSAGRPELAAVFQALSERAPHRSVPLPRTACETLEQLATVLGDAATLCRDDDSTIHAVDVDSGIQTWTVGYDACEMEWWAIDKNGTRPGEAVVEGLNLVLLPVMRPDVHPEQMAALVRQCVPGMARV